MAKVITIKVLYEDQAVEEELKDVVSNMSGVLDTSVDDIGITNDALDDSIANGTYALGDAFRNWVIHLHGHEYWSEEYGISHVNLATRYASTDSPSSTPGYGKKPYTWMLDPSALN